MRPDDIRHRTLDPLYEPSQPTESVRYMPGSPEKKRVLAERLERGEDLWHSDDLSCFRDRFDWKLPQVPAPADLPEEDEINAE